MNKFQWFQHHIVLVIIMLQGILHPSSSGLGGNRSVEQIPQCNSPASHNVSFCNQNVQNLVTKWCIVRYLSNLHSLLNTWLQWITCQDNYKMRREVFMFWDLVHLILETYGTCSNWNIWSSCQKYFTFSVKFILPGLAHELVQVE